MKQLYYIMPFLLLFCAVAVFAQNGTEDGEKQKTAVEIMSVIEQTVYDTTLYGARLEPKTSSSQIVPFAGTIVRVFVKEGQQIKKNSSLYSIVRTSQISTGDYVPMTVYANSSGVVTNITVSPDEEVADKTVAMVIADISLLKATIQVSDKDIPYFSLGQTCIIPKQNKLKGAITHIALIPDTKSGLFNAEISFPNSQQGVFPGKFVTIEIPINPVKGIFIPSNLIFSRYGKKFVWLIQDNRATMKEIEVIQITGLNTMIKGLNDADTLAVTNTRFLTEGAEVSITEKPANDSARTAVR